MARILIVEDDESLLPVYKEYLKEHKLVFTCERDIVLKEIRHVDAVISDYDLNDPFFKFEHVKALAEMFDKPIVLISGMAKKPLFKHQLAKPFTRKDVLSLLEDALLDHIIVRKQSLQIPSQEAA